MRKRLLLSAAVWLPTAVFAFRTAARQQEEVGLVQLPPAVKRQGARSAAALGSRCGGDAPARLGENTSARGGRAAEILTDLWACRSPAGVRAVGGRMHTEVPGALEAALRAGPEAAKGVLAAESVDLPSDTVNWGSGGNNVAAPENETAAFFGALFEHIEGAGLGIEIRPQDLFHGHVFGLPPLGAGSRGELVILFHAKEYPEDLREPKGVGSGFTTQSPEYADRNLLFLASTNTVYVIDPVEASDANYCMLANLEIQQWLPDWAMPWIVRTIDERSFIEVGSGVRLLDVNFLPRSLANPDGGMAVFTKAF